MHLNSCFYFFFQAEDGIRDPLVTGVQTCALPIFGPQGQGAGGQQRRRQRHRRGRRSEERRVGKECRSRWSPNHLKKERRITEGGGEAKGTKKCVSRSRQVGVRHKRTTSVTRDSAT